VSRGYDGPQIDDFRDSGWERERPSTRRDSSPERAGGWQPWASVRLKLQELREAETDSDQLSDQSREHSESSRPTLYPGARELQILSERDRAKYADRNRSYSLRPSEIDTLAEVGKFRVVKVEDLAKFNYADDRSRMESDLRNLTRQGLVAQRGTST
jgi:hypothetical protein